jgi:cysteine-rich repeat protein
MNKKRILLIFIFIFLLISLINILGASAPVLNVNIQEVNEKNVVMNGVVFSDNSQITRISWNWGDGTSGDSWFPASHAYGSDDLYNVVVTAFDANGLSTTKSLSVRIGDVEDITITGNHIQFIDFPGSYFDNAEDISNQEFINVMDAIYDVEKDLHNNVNIPNMINVYYKDDLGGAYAVARESSFYMGYGFVPKDNSHAWDVYIHEMSHIMAGRDSNFLKIAENGYSAYFDEHQAEIAPEYVYQRLKQGNYGISLSILNNIKTRSDGNTQIQNNAYNNYLSGGKNFYIQQNNVAQATMTGQATSKIILDMLNTQSDYDSLEKFYDYLKGDKLKLFFFDGDNYNYPSSQEIATYVVVAYSSAFEEDLTSIFRTGLNYDIDDNLYSFMYEELNGISPPTVSSICNNGIVESGELCDSNSKSCSVNGYLGIQSCSFQCAGWGFCQPIQYCGDDAVNGNESCDDGNINNEDGCSSICTIEVSTQINDTNISLEEENTSLENNLSGDFKNESESFYDLEEENTSLENNSYGDFKNESKSSYDLDKESSSIFKNQLGKNRNILIIFLIIFGVVSFLILFILYMKFLIKTDQNDVVNNVNYPIQN